MRVYHHLICPPINRRIIISTIMSIQTRGLVFATFFGNCLVVGLLVASLTTDNWIQAQAKRNSNHTTKAAEGRVNFGLFYGTKDLNVGLGTRQGSVNGKSTTLLLLLKRLLTCSHCQCWTTCATNRAQ